ncbi:Arabinogalactan peptide 15 [Hibiscus syriacus]|uniref:Arabinogalactan peptide 15 n=1 Tax=Hibiscus syriacus TaxID=106335 RepID=A0A6A3BZE6_HIBSY|nr:Arabinogalactan peptide 15 [Hibiscus syriacus]
MALTKASLILAFVAVCALMGSAIAAEAPAPSPTSETGSISPSFVAAVSAAATALVFGSTLRI